MLINFKTNFTQPSKIVHYCTFISDREKQITETYSQKYTKNKTLV